MSALPRALRFELGGRSFMVIHGRVGRINCYIFSSTPENKNALIGGHCGIPFGQRIGERTWLNARVIGMPANDGTADGWFMMLEPEGRRVKASWHRLGYDAETMASVAVCKSRLFFSPMAIRVFSESSRKKFRHAILLSTGALRSFIKTGS